MGKGHKDHVPLVLGHRSRLVVNVVRNVFQEGLTEMVTCDQEAE